MRILSIDYGDKKTGLAISDENKKLARRFLTLKNKSPENIIFEINKIISTEKIGKLIIGLPIGLKTESEQTRKTGDFIRKLEKEINIPIVAVNEVFTSKMSRVNLLNSGIKKEKIKDIIDQESARIILQEYLDKNNK